MNVEQHCHVPKGWGIINFMYVPWNAEELQRMNRYQNRIPAINKQCQAPYPHTHHFVKVGD